MTPQTSLARQANPEGYTAAQIANAARMSKRTVLRALADTPPAGSIIVQGNETAVWTFDILTAGIQSAITSQSAACGLTIADYLETFVRPWQPALPLAEIADACLADARKLRAALLPSLQRMDATTLLPADRIRLGLEDYKCAFGHSISERHLQRLLMRTLWRDGGMKDWQRLEIYLPEKSAYKPDAKRLLPAEMDFKPLSDAIQAFTDPTAPARTEIAAFWAEAFEFYQAGAETRREQRALRRELVKFLYRHAPWLASSKRALRVAFDRKYARWIENGESSAALLDGRELKRGEKRAPEIPNADVDKIVWHAARNYGGRVAPALRDFAVSGERSGLDAGTVEIITRHHARKSQFNRRLTARVAGDVKAIKPFFLNKKVRDDATAHVERDYSKLASMEIINADDFTFGVYFYVPDGNGWFNLTRGQCLLMLDVRSWKIIAWSLQPERNYNSLVIRTLMNHVCTGWGIPGTWYFERGIWQNSHVVKGTAPQGWDVAWPGIEVKTGWETLGVQFRHAIRARTKPVERVGGLLQDLMHGVRGYCGRDERRDCPEVTSRALRDIQFRRVNHPGELFLSFDEWHEQLGQLIDRYNAASQDGKVLQGLSPDEAFEKFWPHGDPPTRLDANSWHLVAHYVSPKPVTTNGICFRIGSKSFVYRNERTGRDRGKTLLAWFDPECPESICVTDMNKKNPYLVERSRPVDFLAEPGNPVFERETANAASHSVYPRARYNVLKAKFEPTFRRNLVDAETAETAQEMQRQRTEKVTEQRQASATRNRASVNFHRLGMAMPARLSPEQADAARELAKLLQKHKKTSNEVAAPLGNKSLTEHNGKFTYHLKPSGSDESKYVDYLLERLTVFRKAGKSFGQNFNSAISFNVTRKIAQNQIGGDIYAPENFEAVCVHLKHKIDATILGKRNQGKGIPNYHEFEANFAGAGEEKTL
ncbi:MAG: hypothetical protein ACLPRE_11355 [Limisphaerales bacterium]